MNAMTDHLRVVRTTEAARAIGISTATLRRWSRSGVVTPAFRTSGGQDRWNLDDLARQLRSQQGGPEDHRASPRSAEPPVVAAIVTSHLGVLAARRNDNTPPWTFIAGKIEPGESQADTAIREVKEETGLTVLAGEHEIGRRLHPGTGRTMIYLPCAPTGGTDVFAADHHELAEVRWLSLDEAEELLPEMFEPVRTHLQRTLR
ncbi:NUDIX domain-containing protein [Pseudonocardia sp. P1]|nr:hypothetical protein Ae707Ps1_6265c [Pseudonocardia sp. Ae707_Ps1]OLM08768.1 hypothetical protein Ae707Ps1_6281c [Pseudonocardia sp. Ae707_Ps1]